MMIGKTVRVSKDHWERNVTILDKRMTCSSEYYDSPIMNNASFEVYVGRFADKISADDDDYSFKIVEFVPTDIIKIY